MEKSKKKAIGTIVFGIGFMAILLGALTDLYDVKIGVLIMLGVWIIGGAVATLIFGGKEDVLPPKQT